MGVAVRRSALLVVLVASFAGCISLASLSNGAGGSSAGEPDAPSDGPPGTDRGDGASADHATGGGRADLYRAAVLQDSPIGYWRFDETEGTAAKDEMGEHPGVYTYAPTLGRPGLFGSTGAVELPESSHAHVAVPGDAFSFAGLVPYTVEVWVKPRVFSNYQIIASTESSPPRNGWSVFATDDGKVNYEVWRPNDGGSQEVRSLTSGGTVLSLDRFQHVVATFNGDIMKLYVDGVLAKSNPAPSAAVDTEGLILGCRRSSGDVVNCLNGWVLDEAAIYDFPLTSERVLAHFQLGEP